MTDFTRPTLAALIARAKGDIESEVDGVTAQVRRRPEYALAVALAGLADSQHGHLAWDAEQIIVDQAVERFVLRWGGNFGINRKAPAKATGTILVTGTGGTLTAGSEWIWTAGGVSFTVDADHAGLTSESVAITAEVGGTPGNVPTGTTLQLVSSTLGISSTATVQAPGLEGGTELEALDAYIARVLDRMSRPPLGGASGDYRAWALEVPGVYKAWEYKGTDGLGNPGIGKVAVTFVQRDVDGNLVLPDADAVQVVQDYLDARAPAQVIVFAPTPQSYDWAVTLNPIGAATAVTAEVKAMLARDAEPGGTIFRSRFDEAVSAATGEVSHSTSVPAGDVSTAFGVIAVPGTPSYS